MNYIRWQLGLEKSNTFEGNFLLVRVCSGVCDWL